MDWKQLNDGSGLDYRTIYNYNASGQIASINSSAGTKLDGQTQMFTVTYDYSADGSLIDLTYKYVDGIGQKFIVEGGYTADVKLNPLILQRVTSIDYYFGVGGIAQLAAKFPKAIRNYEGGQVFEGYGFSFDIANNRVNKISSTQKLPNSESTINYEFQY